MFLKRTLHHFLRRFGYDLVRYPHHEAKTIAQFVTRLDIDTVLDVGANVGTYGSYLRERGFLGRIISFEPLAEPFAQLQAAAARDGNWTAHNVGLGEQDGQSTINVGRMTVFSSLLKPTANVQNLEEGSQTERQETIQIRSLDSLWPALGLEGKRVYLKIDTQGYEKQILAGATESLKRIAGLQTEVSLTRIYEGQPQVEDLIPFVRERGFVLYALWDGFSHRVTGQLMEMDALFVRSDSLPGGHSAPAQ